MDTCRECRYSVWRKRIDGKQDYNKLGLCRRPDLIQTGKQYVISAKSLCDKWEKKE